ncbi:DMT family transporter [Bosea sp. (in: a-proteobacteria)]|uniref:DMT family transporter n=1 Tax=Bosea sp. (in: a-proteobacteria) TaxID=1871050 RepID=UPI002735EDAB|nr:DMT family transporter [Bosea sp. (in: a-proteobacteria)]MDP3409091.1 DMT family transporter [Bosea sp. (in: a-proteobacteria)]
MDPITPPPDTTQLRDRRLWRLAFGGMVVAMLIFGANFVVSRHAVLNGLTSHDLLAMRFGIAGLLLLPGFLAGGAATCNGIGWGRGILLAIMSGFPMSFLLLTGVTYAPAAHGATIGPGLVTVISIIGSVVLFRAIITRQLVIGIVAVLLGLVALGIAGTTHTNPSILFGDLCFVGVGLIWGMYPLLVQLWRLDALKATSVVAVLSMVYLPFYALFFFRGFDVAPWWVIVLHGINQGVLNVILGLWLWSVAARRLGPAVAGRFPPTIPVIGTLLAIPVLGEIPSGLQVAGIGLIIGGLFIASWRRSARSPA